MVDDYEENVRLLVSFVRKLSVSGIVGRAPSADAAIVRVMRDVTIGEWERAGRAASALFEELRETGT